MRHQHLRKATAIILTVIITLALIPSAFAAQPDAYRDPVTNWIRANDRTNELDANAVVTHETFNCAVCGHPTSFLVFRVPEYTKNGETALNRNVMYSDGTLTDGVGTGNMDDGLPGVNAAYTGYHWTKAVCETCGTVNGNAGTTAYRHGKNVYKLDDCAAEFMHTLAENATYAQADSTYHTKTTVSGEYCSFCFGTYKETQSVLENHNIKQTVVSQLANQRFVITDSCADCGYKKTTYVGAKSVIASHFGNADGEPHTVTVSDLSESGVAVTIRYGNSAESCTLTSAPNYVQAGYYTVYYAVSYTYKGVSMTENGAAYVWLLDNGTTGGSNQCVHNYVYHDTVPAGCLALGYDRYLCIKCGGIEKRNYTAALGHRYQSVVIRDATCETPGKVLEICTRCGDVKVTETPKGEHKYETKTITPTCTCPGYKLKICSVCGDRHITDITAARPHDYKSHVTPSTCTAGGHTAHICKDCGRKYITDRTKPLGHKESDWITDREPEPGKNGCRHKVCTRCGEILETEEIAPPVDDAGVRHGAYIYGYPDGTVRPEGKMTRAEAAAVFARLLAEGRGENIRNDVYTTFPDVKQGDWYAGYVGYLQSYNVLSGYGDGTFRGNEPVTRAEFVTMAVRFNEALRGEIVAGSAGGSAFSDVYDQYWAVTYIRAAEDNQWVSGYPDGTFQGDKGITRAEVVTIVNRLLSRVPDKTYMDTNLNRLSRFSDLTNLNYWAYYQVMEAANGHILASGDGEVWSELYS